MKFTLREIRQKNTEKGFYFFSKDTTRFFKGEKKQVIYYKYLDLNVVICTHKEPYRIAHYLFNEKTGNLRYITKEKVMHIYNLDEEVKKLKRGVFSD
jgi:hypothetical protein